MAELLFALKVMHCFIIAIADPHEVAGQLLSAGVAPIDVRGEIELTGEFITQSIASFVACQHSRDTFAPCKLADRVNAFDRELTELLTPYAKQGQVCYRVRTRVTWGAIRCP